MRARVTRTTITSAPRAAAGSRCAGPQAGKPAQVFNWPRIAVLQSHTDTDLSVWNMLEVGPALLLGWSGRESRVLVATT